MSDHSTSRILKGNQSDMRNRPRIRFGEFSAASTAESFEPLADRSVGSNRSRGQDGNNDWELQSALAVLRAAGQELNAQRDRWLEESQAAAVQLGIAIAERLLRRTLATEPSAVVDLVRSTLQWSPSSERIHIRLHPDDCELISAQASSLRPEALGEIEFVPDPSIPRGGCVVESPQGIADGRIETVLGRIAEELLG